ncbi:MAG: beta-N-acetylhexosaminidase [Treponema sp.]|jgi:beta-N-acetylhexosaminidase|nr:beta-N-acetylhexosaminidase [Treponema sp.]
MTIEQKIGQRVALGFSGTKVSDELVRLVGKYKAGNVILFKDNLESASQAKALCAEIQKLIQSETGHPAFIAIDQEGGVVVRLPADMVNVPGAMALAATGKTENVALAAKITAAELRRIGVNMNLAPVLDVNCNHDNPAIGNRSFSSVAQDAAVFATAAVKAYRETGLLCCGKHFPGHGDTAVDSHLDLPLVDRSMDELEARELVPFRAAIEAGIPAIMTTHILFPQQEPEKVPATMSARILKGLLRERMGFDGLILSDGMEMKAIKDHYTIPKGCVQAFSAGVDIVFLCHESSDVEASLKALRAAYDEGQFNTQELDASVERILRFKEQYAAFGLNAAGDPLDDTAEDLCRRREQNAALTRNTLIPKDSGKALPPLGSQPFFIGPLAYRSTIASAKTDSSFGFAHWFADHFGGTFIETPVNPKPTEISEIISSLPSASSIVLGTYNAHLNRSQMDLAHCLSKTAEQKGIPFICLALRNPWDLTLLPEQAYGIALWEYTPKSFEAAAALFRGEFVPIGYLSEIKQ